MASRSLRQLVPHVRLGTGVFVSGLSLAGVGALIGSPLLLPPMMATAMIKHSAPESRIAQPRSVIGGHLVGALVGLGVGTVLGGDALGIAVATAVAAVSMTVLDVTHPPAVATAFVALQAHTHLWFPLQVVLAAATLTTMMALLARPLHGQAYPVGRSR